MAAFKDVFDAAGAARIAAAVAHSAPGFDADGFLAAAAPRLPTLELKARVEALTEELASRLPPFPEAGPTIEGALGRPHPATGSVAGLAEDAEGPGLVGFLCWPLARYVGRFGLEHPDLALPLLAQITRRFSSEFAVRPFLVAHEAQTLAYLHRMAQEPDQHLRRWAFEGIWPRLPWGERLSAFVADPSPGLAILERLKDDPEDYVRRSVANHLGDVAKDHPDAMLAVCERWLAESDAPGRAWVVRHACRHPLKQGNPRALALHGYAVPPRVELASLAIAHPTLRPGQAQELTATLRSTAGAGQKLAVDCVLQRPGKRGLREKVFKGKERTLGPGDSVTVALRPKVAAAKHEDHYGGEHALVLAVNGQRLGRVAFEVS